MVGAAPQQAQDGLFMRARDVALVKVILAELLPGIAVWAFGSRANGRHVWRFSDLDLAIDGQLSWHQRGALSQAFDESDLPMKVDVVELPMVDPEFLERIRRDFVAVQAGSDGMGAF